MNRAEEYFNGMGIVTQETPDRVKGIKPDLRTRIRARAERRARTLNAQRIIPSYRWEVVEEDGRYVVVAFQNVAMMKT